MATASTLKVNPVCRDEWKLGDFYSVGKILRPENLTKFKFPAQKTNYY